MQPRADRARLDRGRPVAHLVVAEGHVHEHRVGLGARQRVGGHVLRVAVRLAPVPQHLHQPEQHLPVGLVRVGLVEEPRVRRDVHPRRRPLVRRAAAEVRAPLEQRGVVHAGHA